MDEARVFATGDQDFPTTPALRDRLASAGRIATAPAAKPGPSAGRTFQPLPDDGRQRILLGKAGNKEIGIDMVKLMASRCLVQGSSGAGKSMTLRRIIEQAHAFVTTIVLDPEGEFGNLADHIGAVSVKAAEMATDGLTAMAVKTRQHRIPLHVDLSDLEPDDRIAKAAAFLSGLIATPREFWSHTCMVAVDEAHLLAPHMAASARDAEMRRLGVATLTDLCSRGRKRGITPVIATQRLAKLASSVLAELHNVLIGLNVLDRDVARAADLLGYTYDKASILRELRPGQFVALGPAICTMPEPVDVYPAETQHMGATPMLTPSALLEVDKAREVLEVEQLKDVGGKAAPVRGTVQGVRALDTFLLDPGAAVAARVIGALGPISPNATTVEDLCRHLGLGGEEVNSAVDLLVGLGAADAMPRGESRIVRLSARLRVKLTETTVVGLV